MGDKELKLGVMHRTVAIEKDALATRAEGDAGIPIAISSETPVERWFGREVLSHDPEAIVMDRAKRGLPLLMDHDTGTHIGIVRDITIGKDKVLRGRMEFGNHPDAQWIRKDVEAGIRTDISVGYRIHSVKLTASDAERGDEYTADKWEPMEVSSVPVPADATVGVGRHADDGALPVVVKGTVDQPAQPEREGRMSDATPATVPAKVPSVDEISREIAGIYQLAAEYGLSPEDAGKAIERGISRDRFASEILERKKAEHAAKPTAGVDMTEREHKNYRLTRAILGKATGNWKDAGLELEVSRTLAKQAGADEGRLFIPLNTRASVTGNIVATSSLGGAGVATEMRELIELLRNKSVVVQAGATQLFGLSSNVSFPRQITANTLNWVGENPSSANTPGAATFDNVTLSPKTAMVSTAYSRQLLVQSSFDASSVVANDLALVNAIGLDYAALNGVGSSNQPTGIRVQSGITNKTLGTNGANLAFADVVSVETSIAAANADIGAIKWLVTPGTRGKLKTTLENTTSGASYIYRDDMINGYPALVTNQLPSTLTKGTSTTICHSAVFGVWSELLVATFGGGMELIVDPYSVAGQNMIAVHSVLMADIAVRHPAAFAKIDDILVS